MKKSTLILIITLVLICIFAAEIQGVTGEAFRFWRTRRTTTTTTPTISCTDSDNGLNYNTRGTVTYTYRSLWSRRTRTRTYTDKCKSKRTLTEYYCSNNKLKIKKYKCPNGCSNGACIKEQIMTKPDFNLIKINKNFKKNSEYSLTYPDKIFHLSLNGNIKLKKDSSFVRVVLKDQNNKEYLVLEANYLLNNKNYKFTNLCEETCDIEATNIKSLVIELTDASIHIDSINFEKGIIETGKKALHSKSRREKSKKQKEKEKISKLNRKIKEKGLKWTAGETSVSQLTYEEKKNLFGGEVPNLQGFEYYQNGVFELVSDTSNNFITAKIINFITAKIISSNPLKEALLESFLPESFDWRNQHGENWLTPVKNQGGCGSCWAFAATGATETLVNLYYNQHINLDLSEQDALSCSNVGSCSGGWPGLTLDYYTNTSIVDEACFRYTAKNSPCSNKCSNWNKKVKIGGKISFTYPKTEEKLKKMIVEQGAVSGGIYSWHHAMQLVGYYIGLDGSTIWIFKNSWGIGWGEKGFVKIKTNIDDIGYTHALLTPVIIEKVKYNISCVDKDKDGFCNWGISITKPNTCPSFCKSGKDIDDSNAKVGTIQLLVKLNRKTDRSCNDICNDYGKTCISVGTDTHGTNAYMAVMMYQCIPPYCGPASGIPCDCAERPQQQSASCSTTITSSPKAETNCRCEVPAPPTLECSIIPSSSCGAYTDSDGGAYLYTKGTISDGTTGFTDKCGLTGSKVYEGFCHRNGKWGRYFPCPNGCSNGACIGPPANACIDYDDKNYYTKRSVVTSDSNGLGCFFNDDCISSTILKEYFCDGNVGAYEEYTCPNGCSHGACISESRCSDTDNGANLFVKGTITTTYSTHTWTDLCQDYSTWNAVTEYACTADDMVTARTYQCPDTCSNGACDRPITKVCRDYDHGKNYYLRQNVVSSGLDGIGHSYYDECTSSTRLKEYYCDGNVKADESYTCPNGCLKGACVEEQKCTDTCSSLNYECGIHTICGVLINCGICNFGYTCQNSKCVEEIQVKPPADSLIITLEYVDDIDLEDALSSMSAASKAIHIFAPGYNRFTLDNGKQTSGIWISKVSSTKYGLFYKDIEAVPDIKYYGNIYPSKLGTINYKTNILNIEWVGDIDLEDALSSMSAAEKAIYIHAPGMNRFTLINGKKTSKIWATPYEKKAIFYKDIEKIPDIQYLNSDRVVFYISG